MRSLRRLVLALAAGLALTVAVSGTIVGRQWSAPDRVSEVRGSELTALHELAGTSAALHLVHGRIGPRARDDRLVYQRSLTGGRTWAAERTLFSSTHADRSLIPNFAVAAYGSLVVVAWRVHGPDGSTLYLRRSENGGKDWRPRQRLGSSVLPRGFGVPALSVSGQTVTAAWTARGSGRILLRRSTDGATTFAPVRILGHSRLSIDCGRQVLDGLVGLGVSGEVVHLAWSDANPGACLSNALIVRTSKDGGETWRKARTASSQRTYGWAEVVARGRRLLMSVQRPDGAFVVVRSSDTGATFKERSFEPTGDRALGAADILLPGGAAAWLVFTDVAYDGNKVSGSRIRYRESDDFGKTWGPTEDVTARAAKLRQAANLAANGSKPVVVFGSGRVDGSTSNIVIVRAR